MLMHDLEVLCNEPWCCILCWQFDMQFSYATHLAHPVLCRPTHFNISGYASAFRPRARTKTRGGIYRMSQSHSIITDHIQSYRDGWRHCLLSRELGYSGSQPFCPPGRTMVQVRKSHGPHASHLHITSSIQTNQIYNIIYSLNIMTSKRLHLLK